MTELERILAGERSKVQEIRGRGRRGREGEGLKREKKTKKKRGRRTDRQRQGMTTTATTIARTTTTHGNWGGYFLEARDKDERNRPVSAPRLLRFLTPATGQRESSKEGRPCLGPIDAMGGGVTRRYGKKKKKEKKLAVFPASVDANAPEMA